jgi:hypothetical protein
VADHRSHDRTDEAVGPDATAVEEFLASVG